MFGVLMLHPLFSIDLKGFVTNTDTNTDEWYTTKKSSAFGLIIPQKKET